MIHRKALWSPTGGLYAVAAGLVILAIATGLHRYQFASSSLGGEVWRGDTITGRAVLCAPEPWVAQEEARGDHILTRC